MNIPMIDTLTATIDIENYQESTKDLLAELENKKNEAKSLASKCSNGKVSIFINGITFEVLANGSKGYAYILHNPDYEVKFAQFRSNSKDFYPIFVRIKSESLWCYGHESSWNQLLEWLNSGIGKVISNKINRLDLCCHTDELLINESDYETFKGNFHNDQLFRFRRKVNAMIFGSRDSKVYCRIYNKTLEVTQSKKKMWFFGIWQIKGLNTSNVWNVEFELKRDFFKEKKIDSVENAFSKIKSIWIYCTSEWLVKVSLERTRIERCSTDKTWESIQMSFSEFKAEKLITREKQLQTEAEALIPGTIGNLTSFAARLGNNNIDEVILHLQHLGNKYLKRKNTNYENEIDEKMELLNLATFEV